MKIRIATWNIACGRKMNSTDTFDYAEKEDFEYFKDQLERLNLDIICLQESQFNKNDSFARRLAESLDFAFVAETPGWPSHVDKDHSMTPAIISRTPILSSKSYLPPHPDFKLIHKGKELPPFDRYFLEARFNGFSVVTAHPEPLRIFDLSYETSKGLEFGRKIDEMVSRSFSAPIVIAADLNFANIPLVFPLTTNKLQLREALPEIATTPIGKRQDHIAFSKEFEVVTHGIVKTETDHYLCWAELELK